ncbi:GDSL-type esterase/lipase family protein [Dyella sp. RRB7]|uniref:GDSL-type esterase/lipase family protein n=1 Tax=Dyella sp. RRB7 TaxID=2919502 RepID=UPI001FA9C6C0|nr:GDSL-type esterase/lipase family protein [Dyella sp. RRB7]
MSQKTIPQGMVDELEPTPRTNTPFERAVLDYILKTGPRDMEMYARITDPQTRTAYEAAELQRRATDWPHLGMYRGENASLHVRPDVVFIGCSITEIWQHGDASLFSNGIVGRGISGQTSQQLLLRFYPDVVALRPKVVHILCGSNDIAGNTGPCTPQDYKNNIMAMMDLAFANGMAVVIGSIPPSNQFNHRPEMHPAARIAELNTWLREIAGKRGATYVDYFSALTDIDGSLPPKYSNDGLHPNAAGYEVMRPLALAAIRSSLAAARRLQPVDHASPRQ